MKQIVIFFISLLVIVNISFAQEVQTKTKMFGVNPFGLLINIYSGHYGQITNDGANELNFPFFFWKPTDELTMLGAGAKYRIYKDGKGKGAVGFTVTNAAKDYIVLLKLDGYSSVSYSGSVVVP